MAESCSRSQLTKIALGITCFFFVIVIVCFLVGGPLYIQEHYKTLSYIKDSCRVRSTTYETISKCIARGTKSTRYVMCYIPVWYVEFGQNGTHKEAIRGSAEYSYNDVEPIIDRYKVDSSYPCWYNKNKSSQLTWYRPTTYYALILLIIGGIAIPFAIISLIIFCRLRTRADL